MTPKRKSEKIRMSKNVKCEHGLKFVNFRFVKNDDLKFKVSNLTNLRCQNLTNLSHD